MTRFDPSFAPHIDIHYGLTIMSSGQKDVSTKFRTVYAAIPMSENKSSHANQLLTGFSVVRGSNGVVSVFANCSGDDDSGSGVLPDSDATFKLVAYGTQ